MITTNDEALVTRLKLFRNHGMIRSPSELQNQHLAFDENGEPNTWYYEMHDIGWNLRLSDIHAALGRSQLRKLDQFTAKRRALVEYYDRMIERLAPKVRPVDRSENCNASWHLYTVLIDFEKTGKSRNALMRRLRTLGVGTQVHYIPVHLQPYYVNKYEGNGLPGAEGYYSRALTLPLFPSMSETDVRHVVSCVEQAINETNDGSTEGRDQHG